MLIVIQPTFLGDVEEEVLIDYFQTKVMSLH